MTLFITHLSLEAIIFWTFISTSEKERFSENKGLFWLIISFSILPDFDIFFGIHRGISHSVVFPMLIAILGTIAYYYFNYKEINSEDNTRNTINAKKSFWGRCTLYASILWLIHIALDLDYPLAIFYPLSDRLYQINFIYILDLMPWLIFPAMIIGVGFEVIGYPYLRGLTTYFINLPPSTREEIFGGTTASFSIDNFFIHFFLFLVFFVYVAKPMLPKFELKRIEKFIQQIKFDGPILGLGVILIIIGFLMGPMIGTSYTDQESITSTFKLSKSSFSPTIALTFEPTHFFLPSDSKLHFNGKMTTYSESDSFSQILLLTTRDTYNNVTSEISRLFNQFPPNSSDNLVEFELRYEVILQNIHSTSLAINESNQNETVLREILVSNSYTLVGIIESWNSSLISEGIELSENVKLEANIKTDRFSIFVLGITLVLAGIVVSFLSVIIKRKE